VNENASALPLIRSTFVWRTLRTPIGALLVCTLSTARSHHNCGAGYKWFENYGAYFAAVVVFVTIMAFRRAFVAIGIAALITVAFDFAAAPVYLKWVHSAYAPPFAGGSGFSPEVLKSLRAIDDVIDEAAAREQSKRAEDEATERERLLNPMPPSAEGEKL
jgi:hypothetical protein